MIVKVVVPDSIYAKVFFARGEQGPQGNTGIQGVQGPTGPAGLDGINGLNGATGVGYTGVSSTSLITIGAGLKTWTVSNVGAFLPGMRIRAIHNSSPTTWMEGPANVASGTTIIITVDKFNGSGSHDGWLFAVAGEIGQTGSAGTNGTNGSAGASGVVSVIAPITNSGTSSAANIGIDQSGLTLAQSQVAGLVTALAGTAKLATANAFTVGGHVISAEAIGVIPMVLKGASGQTASLQQWQEFSTTPSQVNSTGQFRIRTFANSVGFTALGVGAGASTELGIVVRGASSQSADMIEIHDNSANILAGISATGRIVSGVSQTTSLGSLLLGTVNTVAQQLAVVARETTTVGAVIRGAASATADLTQWQNSGGTALASVSNAGVINAAQFLTTGLIRGGGLGSSSVALSSIVSNAGAGHVIMQNYSVIPATPATGGVLYVDAGALKYKGSSGTVTTIAIA